MKIASPLIAACLFMAQSAVYAQSYSIQTSAGTYTELENPRIITTTFANQNYFLDVPFSITPFGTSFDLSVAPGLVVTTNGFVEGVHSTSDSSFVIAALAAKMGRRDARSAMLYAIEGEPGSRVLKIEWRNAKLVGNPADDSMNVQLWLFENSSDFEVHVGQWRISDPTAYNGFEGPAVGVAIGNANLSAFYRTFGLRGYDGHLSTDTINVLVSMDATPGMNMIYRFQYGAPAAVAAVAVADGSVRLLPNPCRNAARIVLPDKLAGMRAEMLVYDQMGREVRHIQDAAHNPTIDTGDLPPGVYHCLLIAGGLRYPAVPLIVR
jgi:hypothetical protein